MRRIIKNILLTVLLLSIGVGLKTLDSSAQSNNKDNFENSVEKLSDSSTDRFISGSKEDSSTEETVKNESNQTSESNIEEKETIVESTESVESSESTSTEETTDSKIVQPKISSGSLKRELPALQKELVPSSVPQLSAIKFIDTVGLYLSGAALDNQGAVWMWGYNSCGLQGVNMPEKVNGRDRYQGGMKRVPYFIENNISISKIWGSYHTMYALSKSGKLYAWGRGYEGQIGNGTSYDPGLNNLTPKEVDFPTNEKIVELYPGTEAAHCIYATTESGNVYAWGYRDGGRIPFLTGIYVTKPTKIPELSDLNKSDKFISMSMGNSHGIIATTSGKVYTFGTNVYGERGTSDTTISQQLSELTYFSSNNLTPVEVSADMNNSFILTDAGEIYQFGQLYFETTAGNQYRTPRKVQIDATSAEYEPFFRSITGGKFASHALDQYGRTWIWGKNNYYQFGTDGPLYGTQPTTTKYDYKIPSKGKLDTYLSLATQIPQNLGDGDTQYNQTVPKAPVFSKVTYNGRIGFQLTGYQNQGMWSDIDDATYKKHPTIYDKKYYKTKGTKGSVSDNAPSLDSMRKAHEKVYMINESGDKLVYVVRKDGTNTISGNFYVAKDSYTGSWFVNNQTSTSLPTNVTEETDVPVVKEEEKNWIELVTGGEKNDFTGTQSVEPPGMTSMASYQSSMQFLDSSGNLYKTSLDGSGTIAWGWDYDPVYDWYGGTGIYGTDGKVTSSHATDGIFDNYCYEIMFMRGAPRIIPGSINLDAPLEKHYTSQKSSEKLKIEVGLGSAFFSSQLNLTIEPELQEAKYLIMPYNSNDDNSKIESPSEEQFNEAYNNATSLGYNAIDLADKNGWKGTKQKLNEDEVKLIDESVEIKDNCIVWVLVKTNYYGAEPTVTKRIIFDNFYTDANILQQGVDHDNLNNVLYKPTDKKVTKVTEDGIEKLVGFPLDIKGNIIGTPDSPPKFKYDKVKIESLTDSEWTGIFADENFITEQINNQRTQILSKTKKDFVDSGNTWDSEVENKVISWINSWIEDWVKDEWLPKYKSSWMFYTPQSSLKNYNLNGIDSPNNDDLTSVEGDLAVCDEYVHSFHYKKDINAFAELHYLGVDDVGEKLDPFKMESEEVLRGVTYKRMPPTNLIIDEVEYNVSQYKSTNGKPATSFPIDVSGANNIDADGAMSFKVADDTEEMTVNIIYKAFTSVKLHARQIIQNPSSSVKRPSNGFMMLNNVKLPNFDQKISTKNIATHSGDINKSIPFSTYTVSLEKSYKGIAVGLITPQYYDYVGFVLSETESGQDISNLVKSSDIHLNCGEVTEYWLTIYLEPMTTINDYAWDQKTNDLGVIKIP